MKLVKYYKVSNVIDRWRSLQTNTVAKRKCIFVTHDGSIRSRAIFISPFLPSHYLSHLSQNPQSLMYPLPLSQMSVAATSKTGPETHGAVAIHQVRHQHNMDFKIYRITIILDECSSCRQQNRPRDSRCCGHLPSPPPTQHGFQNVPSILRQFDFDIEHKNRISLTIGLLNRTF